MWSLIFYEKYSTTIVLVVLTTANLWGGSVISAGTIHDLRRVKVPGTGPLWNPWLYILKDGTECLHQCILYTCKDGNECLHQCVLYIFKDGTDWLTSTANTMTAALFFWLRRVLPRLCTLIPRHLIGGRFNHIGSRIPSLQSLARG